MPLLLWSKMLTGLLSEKHGIYTEPQFTLCYSNTKHSGLEAVLNKQSTALFLFWVAWFFFGMTGFFLGKETDQGLLNYFATLHQDQAKDQVIFFYLWLTISITLLALAIQAAMQGNKEGQNNEKDS